MPISTSVLVPRSTSPLECDSTVDVSLFSKQQVRGINHINQVAGSQINNYHSYISHDRTAIEELKDYSIIDAGYTSRRLGGCLEETREKYINDIARWMRGEYCEQECLLWVYGAAGTGKSRIAHDCAKVVGDDQMLGGSFFLHGQIKGDTSSVFLTIAHQLATRNRRYNAALTKIMKHHPEIFDASHEHQFEMLFVKPFARSSVETSVKRFVKRFVKPSVGKLAILVDGLDECEPDAGTEIAKIVAESIAKHGTEFPLRWIFFSRPYHAIRYAFSCPPGGLPGLFRELEILTNHEEIRFYFQKSLDPAGHPGIAFNDVLALQWPSNDDLDALVRRANRHFLYAAVLVRFIMDRDSDPKERLQCILDLEDGGEDGGFAELCYFYSTKVMERVPKSHLQRIQQTFLAHAVTPYDLRVSDYYNDVLTYANGGVPMCTNGSADHERDVRVQGLPLRIIANLIGRTLIEVRASLEYLCPIFHYKESDTNPLSMPQPIPGQEEIVVFHRTFLQFLAEEQSSKEYCIKKSCHYRTLALRALELLDTITAMNGDSPRKKRQKLQKLLKVFLDKHHGLHDYFKFRDELVYGFLSQHTLEWCRQSSGGGQLDKVLKEQLGKYSGRKGLKPELTPKHKWPWQHLLDNRSGEEMRPASDQVKEPDGPSPEPMRPERNWESIASAIQSRDRAMDHTRGLLNDPCRETVKSANVLLPVRPDLGTYIEKFQAETKTRSPDDLSDFDLLEFYGSAWTYYSANDQRQRTTLHSNAPPESVQAVDDTWLSFYQALEGYDHQLTGAAMRTLKQWRDRDMFKGLYSAHNTLRSFNEIMVAMTRSQPQVTESSKTKYIASTKQYYSDFPVFATGESLDFRYLEDCLSKEYFLLNKPDLDTPWSGEIMAVCVTEIIAGRIREIQTRFKEILESEDGKRLTPLLGCLWQLSRWCSDGRTELQEALAAHICQKVPAMVEDWQNRLRMYPDDAFTRTLFKTHEQMLETAERLVVRQAHRLEWYDCVTNAFRSSLIAYPNLGNVLDTMREVVGFQRLYCDVNRRYST